MVGIPVGAALDVDQWNEDLLMNFVAERYVGHMYGVCLRWGKVL